MHQSLWFFVIFWLLVVKYSRVCISFVLWQRMQLAAKLLMFTVKLGGGGVQQLCFVIW